MAASDRHKEWVATAHSPGFGRVRSGKPNLRVFGPDNPEIGMTAGGKNHTWATLACDLSDRNPTTGANC